MIISPGPWKVTHDREGNGLRIIRDADGKSVADLVLPANARLIAAAPELLEAVRSMADSLPSQQQREEANALIAHIEEEPKEPYRREAP
jgi:hypothetical protein